MANQKQEPQSIEQPIERAPSAPVQQADAVPEHVDLIGVLADEFGVAVAQARREIEAGAVTIDGEPYREDVRHRTYRVPRSEVEGKTIEVWGGETQRTYRFQIQ